MNLKHLEAFIKIVDCGGFFPAAEELFTTQSSLSKQMQTLERELQVTLFDRSKRSSRLTEAGKILYQKAPGFLEQYHQLLNSIGAASHVLRLAVLPVWEHYGIPKYLLDFSSDFPHIELNLQESQNIAIPDMLHSGTCDLGVFRSIAPEQEEWHYITLGFDELVLVVPPDSPYPNGTHVSLSEFKNENFILLIKETQLFEHSMKSCQKAGFDPKIIYRGASAETIHYMVSNHKGVALFMKQVALHQQNSDNKILYFQETAKSQLIIAFDPNHTLGQASRLFWNYIKKHADLQTKKPSVTLD